MLLAPFLIGAGLNIAGSLFNFGAKKKAAKANKAAALENLKLMYNDLNARATQERAAATQATEGVQLEADALEGQTATSAAAGNVTGATVDALLRDVSAQEGRALSTINTNLDFSLGQVKRRQRAAVAQADQTIKGIQKPSLLGLGLEIGGSVLNSYTGYRGL
jgi:hypothetical protein